MDFNLPKVYRTKVMKGLSIPGIIKNRNHYFTDLEVYEDGRVNCWNFKDFEHFKEDVKRGWVSVNIPDNEEISIHSLGSWIIKEGSWIYTQEPFIDYVWSLVKYLNPNLNNIYKYTERKVNGIKIEDCGTGRVYKEKEKIPNDHRPEKIDGKKLNIFLKDVKDEYHLVRLDIYDKHSIFINRYAKASEINLTELEQMISDEKIVSDVPIDAQVHILGLGKFKIQKQNYCVDIVEKLLEIKDIIKVLGGELSSVEKCRKVYEQYLKNPNTSLKTKLKIAYENIPEHERMFVGDMDTRDTKVIKIIYDD